MGLIILILLVIFIVIIDKKVYSTIYTPSIMLSVPFIIICILYDLYSDKLGFLPLNYDVLFIWVFGLFFFWVTGLFVNKIVTSKDKFPVDIYNSENKIVINRYNTKFLNFVFLLSIILLFTLNQAYNIYIVSGGYEAEEYLGKGIQGHLVVIVRFFSIISFLSLFSGQGKVNKFKNLFIILISLSLSVLYGTKSGILILILSYYFSWAIFYNKKISIFHILLAVALGFGIFFLSYSLLFGRLASLDFIWEHMIMYYVSGTASMNAYFSGKGDIGIDSEMLFRSFYNIVYLVSGDSDLIQNVISDEWTFIGNGTVINVKTFFGTIYLYGGLWYGIFSIIVFSFFSHLLLKLVINTKDIFTVALYVFILSTFCFGWFDFYLNTLAVYEYIGIVFFVNLLKKY